ncbi:MAG: hypothetical protein ACJAU1_001282, partial [Psychromonas sp.]
QLVKGYFSLLKIKIENNNKKAVMTGNNGARKPFPKWHVSIKIVHYYDSKK